MNQRFILFPSQDDSTNKISALQTRQFTKSFSHADGPPNELPGAKSCSSTAIFVPKSLPGSGSGAEDFFAGSADLVFAVRFRVLDDFHEFGEVADGLAGGVELEFFGFEGKALFFKFELPGKAISFLLFLLSNFFFFCSFKFFRVKNVRWS